MNKKYKWTIKGKCSLIETEDGSYVVKPTNNSKINDIFYYLKSRSFDYYPNIISNNRNNIMFEYIEDSSIYNPHKGEDLINVVGLLHAKTSYNKEVSEETHREIYEDIKNNILYLKDYYLKYYELFLTREYMSPKEYAFSRNYSKINSALDFASGKLDNWYDLVKDKKSERICLVHNNLSLDHYLKGSKECLISWDKAKFDTPVLDLYKLYKSSYWELEFSSLYNKYKSINNLSKEEEELLFILISLVPEIKFIDNDFECTREMRLQLDYIYKTEQFLSPYYFTNTNNEANDFNS